MITGQCHLSVDFDRWNTVTSHLRTSLNLKSNNIAYKHGNSENYPNYLVAVAYKNLQLRTYFLHRALL